MSDFIPRICVLVLASITVLPLFADSDQPSPIPREYFSIDVGRLLDEFDEQHIVSERPITKRAWNQSDRTPRVVVSPGSEAYLLPPPGGSDDDRQSRIIGEKPKGEEIQGRLYVLQPDPEDDGNLVLARLDFDVDAFVKNPAERKDFRKAKGLHFQRLWSDGVAGAAMFRHLARKSLRGIGEPVSRGPSRSTRQRQSIDNTIELMSGGRAVSENLALDNQLAATKEGGVMKSIDSVRGITVREINWDSWLEDRPTELDPLASYIPHDQYAVFMPSFGALAKLVQEGNKLARPAVQYFEPQSRETNVLAFYQQQLGLPLNGLTRQVGGALIDEVAITGSDPYFRTGTDLAVLMRSKQANFLLQAVSTQIAALAAEQSQVSKVQHSFGSHRITQWSTEDRHFCSYVTTMEDAVVVANSMTQITNILGCADKKRQSLGSLDEYRFFRQRYPRNAKDESALVIISDATIRRWCGPQWRIAASRRTRARATIAEMTMNHADALVAEEVDSPRVLSGVYSVPPAGELTLTSRGVRSDRYGTLQFQTPIAEMGVTRASQSEIKLYEDWRRRYERQWRNAFDPIALKLSLNEDSVRADLSVIPLMIRTQYRNWFLWIGDAKLTRTDRDLHQQTLASAEVALNMQSPIVAIVRMYLSQQTNANVDMLSWIDGSVSVYLDHDREWVKQFVENREFAMDVNDALRELPIAFFIPSKDNLRMTACVVAARAVLDQFSPNMIEWSNAEHNGMSYVIATAVENFNDEEEPPRAYYVTTSEGLTLSLNRHVIERTIDRHLERRNARGQQANATGGEPTSDKAPKAENEIKKKDRSDRPQIVAGLTGRGALTMAIANSTSNQRRMSQLSWNNIPILNYLRHRYPQRDPFEVYQQLLGEKLTEPGGGKYEWSERFQTYESSHYGHHLAPKMGPPVSPALQTDDRIESTLSFDKGGLRATLEFRPTHQ